MEIDNKKKRHAWESAGFKTWRCKACGMRKRSDANHEITYEKAGKSHTHAPECTGHK